jgi:hypothetical protein
MDKSRKPSRLGSVCVHHGIGQWIVVRAAVVVQAAVPVLVVVPSSWCIVTCGGWG